MTIDEKVQVLSTFDNEIGVGVERWDEFRLTNDVGLPLANLMAGSAIKELTNLGVKYIDETFDELMNLADIEADDKDVDSILNELAQKSDE